jgi:hypothetical protein
VKVFESAAREVTRMPARALQYAIRHSSLAVSRMELATLSLDGILVWSCKNEQVLKAYEAPWYSYLAWTTRVIYSSDEDSLAAVVGDSVYMFEANALSLRRHRSIGHKDLRFCRFSQDSKYLLTDDEKEPPEGNGHVLWDVLTGATIL